MEGAASRASRKSRAKALTSRHSPDKQAIVKRGNFVRFRVLGFDGRDGNVWGFLTSLPAPILVGKQPANYPAIRIQRIRRRYRRRKIYGCHDECSNHGEKIRRRSQEREKEREEGGETRKRVEKEPSLVSFAALLFAVGPTHVRVYETRRHSSGMRSRGASARRSPLTQIYPSVT